MRKTRKARSDPAASTGSGAPVPAKQDTGEPGAVYVLSAPPPHLALVRALSPTPVHHTPDLSGFDTVSTPSPVVVVPDTSALETDAFSDDLRRTWARLGPYIIAVPDAARRIRSAGYRGRMETVQSDTLTTAMVPAIRRGQRRAALLPTLLDAAMTHLAVCHGLSARETDVMIDVLAGLTAKETGRRLDISHRTVDIHRAQMMKKVGVRSAGELGQKLSIAAIDLALATARPKPRPSDETSDQAQPARMPYRPAG